MNEEFETHKLNDVGLAKSEAIAKLFDNFLENLEIVIELKPKPGMYHTREISIVRTKLEEACFFAKKAMAQLAVNQIKK